MLQVEDEEEAGYMETNNGDVKGEFWTFLTGYQTPTNQSERHAESPTRYH